MHELYELKDILLKELKEYGKKEKVDVASLEVIDKLSESVWRICRIIDHYENGNADIYPAEYSNRYSYHVEPRMPHYNVSNKRDSMGRYSRGAADNFRSDFQDLMQNAPNDYVRQKMMDVMNNM